MIDSFYVVFACLKTNCPAFKHNKMISDLMEFPALFSVK